MPELPEVETIRRQLQNSLLGLELIQVEVLHEKSWHNIDDLPVVGCEVIGIRRLGKALILDLTNNLPDKGFTPKDDVLQNLNRLSLVVHLKMTGQLVYEEENQKLEVKSQNSGVSDKEEGNELIVKRIAGGHPTGDFVGKLPSKHTRVIIKLKAKSQKSEAFSFDSSEPSAEQKYPEIWSPSSRVFNLYFNDQRLFGWIKALRTEEVAELGFIKKLGKEPWDLSLSEWLKICSKSKKSIKLLLLDQDKIAGIGNIYANDGLWEAGIDPLRPANSLSSKEVERVRMGIIRVLEDGIKYGGASISDYKHLDGMGGQYQHHVRVYGREGQTCNRDDCDGVIEKTKLGGRGTFWCPVCQG